MIKHIVMFKLKPAEKRDELAARAKEDLDGLLGKVPSLRAMEVGIDVSTDNPSADLVLVSVFDDMEGLCQYASHPQHLEFLSWFRPHIALRSVVDYEI